MKVRSSLSMYIQIDYMHLSDIHHAKSIWIEQYRLFASHPDFPTKWKEDTTLLEQFLQSRIESKRAYVAKSQGEVVGFLAYDVFDFHGEKSVFCPVIGHGAQNKSKERVYMELYRHASAQWVKRSIYNHMWTILYQDEKLRKVLFDLGYGSYLVDASKRCDSMSNPAVSPWISEAKLQDREILLQLVQESSEYYASAPLFLQRDKVSEEQIDEYISDGGVFIVWQQDQAAGFIHANISDQDDMINLTMNQSGSINTLGAYIKPEFRHQRLGEDLLHAAINHVRLLEAEFIHVDFETANLLANKFWLKHFTPMLLSLKRNIFKDAIFESMGESDKTKCW